MTKEQIKSFEEAAQPLLTWMAENCCPHDYVVVDVMHAELLSGQMCISSEYNKNLNK